MAAISTTISFSDGDQVTSAKLNEIISGTTMSSGAVVTGNTTLTVTAGQLKVGTITSAEMGAASVATTALINASVTTDKIADENVTAAKLADDSVETAKVLDGNITATKLDGAQTGTAPVFGVRAWVSFDATRNAAGTTNSDNTPRYLYGSGNVTSVTKTSTGVFTVTFTIAMSSANYAVIGSCGYVDGPRMICSDSQAQLTGSFTVYTDALSGSPYDYPSNTLAVLI